MPVIDLELPDEQAARLDRVAMAMRKPRREATAQLIKEALRHEGFPCIEFRGSMASRQACVTGSGLAVLESIDGGTELWA
jgi:predicted transcriptional regulator